MKVQNLKNINSEPAPKEWSQIPEIQAQYPRLLNCEISLQKLKGMNICVWMINWTGTWSVASDFFHVKK